jgi:hypothetical protein
LTEIVRRHEILRTTFPLVGEGPVQRIHPPSNVRLPLIDLERLPDEQREKEAARRTREEVLKSFDLDRLPLIRWVLFRFDETRYGLLHIEHHLLHDGWSFNVFLRELFEIYRSFATGGESTLPELPIQFADFAAWQREWMETEDAAKQCDFWKAQLDADCPPLDLPFDRPRPAKQTFEGASQRVEFPLALAKSLREVCRREGVTLFMTMLAAFVALLHKYSGRDDIQIGYGIANRRWRQTEDLIGMVINNVVLRTDLSGDPDFRQLLDRIRDVTLASYANQDYPFDKVVEALHPRRDPRYNPLFQVMFGFHDAPLPFVELPDVRVRLREALSNESAKFDMNLIVIPHSVEREQLNGDDAEGLTAIWEYNTDLFERATIERMIGHYQELLQGVVADMNQRVSDLPIFQSGETRLLEQWNDTTRDYPETPLHELFEQQAARQPEAVAVVCGDEHLTYRELNCRANRLAHYLQHLECGPRPRSESTWTGRWR